MKKIAVVGSGISGLSCAYFLSRSYEVTVFEANDYVGGHTHTVDVEVAGEQSAIDTGFIVFNDRTYPNFQCLLHELEVPYQKTIMGFSVRNDAIGLEYNGHSPNSLFAQRKNLLSPSFWRMLYDILSFNRQVRQSKEGSELTVGNYLDSKGYGSLFAANYLLPMIAAIWSMGTAEARDFPLSFFVRFFENHGLLELKNRPQWFSIVGGSRSYIPKMTAPFANNIRTSAQVKQVERRSDGVMVSTPESEELFDEVVFACHADEALASIVSPTETERQILGRFPFSANSVVLHTDISLMPKAKRAWASWNYLMSAEKHAATLTYDMNILQCLSKDHTYLVTLNQEIAAEKTLRSFNYSHPVYNNDMLAAQQQWQEISGRDRLHFCGAYWFNGFHEDGVRSSLRVCDFLGVKP